MGHRNKIFRFRGFRHGVPLPLPRIRGTTGPLSQFNPTRAYFQNAQTDAFERLTEKLRPMSSSKANEYQISYYWTSRNNRKGHHAMVVSSHDPELHSFVPLQAFSKRVRLYRNLIRMATYFPYWDISYAIAVTLTVGSLIWLIDGIATFWPMKNQTTSPIVDHVPVVALVGTIAFLVSNTLLMLETLNELQRQCIGWKSEAAQQYDDEEDAIGLRPGDCRHHQANKRNLVGKSPDGQSLGETSNPSGHGPEKRSWRWALSYSELRFHYACDLGFLGSLTQLVSTVIFCIGAITRLPSIYSHLSVPLTYAFVWTPKLSGSLGFVISGVIFMIETQHSWWFPSPDVIGWHVGGWSIVGGVGFLMSTILGLISDSSSQYQSAVALVWASLAFLVASLVQWYESLEKYSLRVEVTGDYRNTQYGNESCKAEC